MSTAEVLQRGMKCLVDNLGVVEAEIFISTLNREKFDYTQWQRDYFDGISAEEFGNAAAEYEKKHPFKGKKAIVI